jgi:hypothetical protein
VQVSLRTAMAKSSGRDSSQRRFRRLFARSDHAMNSFQAFPKSGNRNKGSQHGIMESLLDLSAVFPPAQNRNRHFKRLGEPPQSVRESAKKMNLGYTVFVVFQLNGGLT